MSPPKQGWVGHRVAGAQRQPEGERRHPSPVLDAIEILDYRPNPLARGLCRSDAARRSAWWCRSSPHASAVERLRGVVAALDESRYDLVLFNVESPVHRDQHLAPLTGATGPTGCS